MPPFDLQGHRGARGRRPENTIPAFLFGLDQGIRTLEMDTVISKDHQVVVSHDPFFSAATCSHPDGTPVTPDEEKALILYGMTYEEIAAFDCGKRQHPLFPEQFTQPVSKPLLSDVVAAVDAHVATTGRARPLYNIETKCRPDTDGVNHPDPKTFMDLLYAQLVETGIRDFTTVQSFDVRTLQAARSLDAGLPLSLLIDRSFDAGIDTNLVQLGFTPAIYSPDHRLVDEFLVHRVHELGMRLIPWTVNQLPTMMRLVKMGVDGFITDYPDRASVIREVG